MRSLPTYIFIFVLSISLISPVFAKTQTDFKIIGLNDELLGNVQNALTALKKPNSSMLQITKQVRAALEPYGYFKAQIKVMTQPQQQNQLITIIVDKGEPLRITTIDVEVLGAGRDNMELMKFEHDFPIKVGDIFQAHAYTEVKTEFFRIANNQGYIRAYFESNNVVIDLQQYRATLILHLQTGERYYFGKTKFSRNPYDDQFLARFIPYQQTDAFSNQKLIHLQESMSESFYFKRVAITPDFEHIEDHHVPVAIEVEPPKAQRYAAAIGYGTYTGPRLTLTSNFRRLTDTGQHADIQLRLSSILTGATAKYYIPGRNPIEDKWFFGANLQRFYPRNGKSLSHTIFAGYSKKIGDFFSNLSLNFLQERYTTEQIPYMHRNLLYPNLNISYKKVDDVLRPSFGKAVNFTVSGASSSILSTTSYVQGDLQLRFVYSPASFSRIIGKGEFGYTVAQHLDSLPLSMRFFAGGLGSIRGFPDSNIGPGKYLQLASLEYQNKVINNWWGALFYDIGTATNHFGMPLNKGAGVGVIYQSFIGPVRLYVARAISKPSKPFSVDFSIGPEF